MTTVAEKFLQELKAGKISEAIEVIKIGLQESEQVLIKQKRQELLESYGFIASEAMKQEKEKEASDDEKEDKEVEDDDDSDDDKIDEAYTGKNPDNIKTVAGEKGSVVVTTNDGKKHTISAKDTGGKMPKVGEPISKYVK